MVNICDLKKEPIIDYPTFWDYKVVFEASIDAPEIFNQTLNQRDFKYQISNTSKQGTYKSYLLSVYVNSKEDRLNIFNQLKSKAKFVL
ncbi:hypothetical protein (DUF493 domain) [Campylobacter subantarcticus LMG 24377]|uniref:DUF493 domain protein n=2 Tax=Campylobacter subantarcticus TaxID=497724 RepID=A0A0A8H7F6_9BACT|nr:DUF493 family protein [Campylobacter subantarcticus]EAJ1261826.1 DUF493 domain-containing protein [Campylobacter lari]AJC90053.1 hypothetical protein (DUF493 domain) [Campylobacter subantarcticus LMG 24374]AJC91720.1 hypothetical protein (DUF493 domain) [Campylobacter subantarcticus LMG 24377]EAL3939168.1 DUF493 domain-containing protein [Campylobacter lari]MPB99930.1 DUF493 domain-containing protein [Campylobacter subantarcticus]